MEQVIGAENAEREKSALKFFSERFTDQAAYDEYKGKEREKTDKEIEMIGLANDLTNGLLKKYGLDDFDIPERNFHFLLKEAAPEMFNKALYQATRQGVLVGECDSDFNMFTHLAHEMIHFKSWNSVQRVELEDGETGITDYRVGISMITRDTKNKYLNNLNEAITEEMVKRIALLVKENPLFAEEYKKSQGIAGRLQGVDISDIAYARMEGVGFVTNNFAYSELRKMLNTLIDKLFDRNKDTFSDREEVFEVFARAEMTGRMLPLGRLVDNTFGMGTFRLIGESDRDIPKQIALVDSL